MFPAILNTLKPLYWKWFIQTVILLLLLWIPDQKLSWKKTLQLETKYSIGCVICCRIWSTVLGRFKDMDPRKVDEDQVKYPHMGLKELNLSYPKCTSHDVRKQLNHLFVTFNILGINFHKGFLLFCYQSNRSELLWSIYCTFVLLLIVTNVGRWLGVFHVPSNSLLLIFYTQTSVWALQCMLHYMTFFVDSAIFSNFRAFLNSYQQYIDEYGSTAVQEMVSLKNITRRYVAIYWVVLLIFMAANTHFQLSYLCGYRQYIWPLDKHDNLIMALRVMNVVATSYLLSMWLLITLITCAFCSYFAHEYEIINKEIEKSSVDLEYFSPQLEHFRRKHFEVCKLIKKFDSFFTLHLAGDVVCALGVSCLLLYGILWNTSLRDDVEATVVASLFLCLSLGKVLLQFLFAGFLNEAVSV